MNKKQFSRKVAERHKMTYSDAEWATSAVFDTLAHIFDEDDRIAIQGFGVFKKIAKRETKYRDINTGELVTMPPRNDVHFLCAPRLRAIVNGESENEEAEEQ